MISVPAAAAAAVMASRREQVAAHVPSPGSAFVVTIIGGVSYSYDPISQPPPCGRVTPRWSSAPTALQAVASPALKAGEVLSTAKVLVGPPLSCGLLLSSTGSALTAGVPHIFPLAALVLIRLFTLSLIVSPLSL